MELMELTRCKRCLPLIDPEGKWPASLPGMSIHGNLLLESPMGLVLDCRYPLKSPQLTEFLHQSLPGLGVAQLARLITNREFSEIVDIESLAQAYGIPSGQRNLSVLNALAILPLKFQCWVDEKKFSFREISILGILNEAACEFSEIATKIASLNLTRQQGARAIELSVELIGMGKPTNEVLSDSIASCTDWLKHLENLRHPMSIEADSSAREKLSQLILPSQVQAQWVRRGDVSGVEMKVFFSSPSDFQKKLRRLEALQGQLEDRIFSKDGPA